MRIFGFDLEDTQLTSEEQAYLEPWRSSTPPSLESIWAAMDKVWDDVWASGLATEHKMEAFYRHPVWLLNGIFTEVDPVSTGHRDAISRYISSLRPAQVCDYGGGFGALARRIATLLPQTRIVVIEPYPHPAARALAMQHPNLTYAEEQPDHADVVIAQDVLEHVSSPIELTARLALMLRKEGILIAASCFQPVIKCHLPETFHLLQSYRHVVAPLGLDFCQTIPGAEHAEVFRRNAASANLPRALRREQASRMLSPLSHKLQRWVTRTI